MKDIPEKLRAYFFVIITVAAGCACIYRLMQIQIVSGDEYLLKSRTTSVETQSIDAPRGEIADINGQLLVSNKSCFNVSVDKAFFPSDDSEKNRIILETAEIVLSQGKEYIDILPMTKDKPFETVGEDDEISEMLKSAGVQVYATSDEIMNAFYDNYNISDEYTDEEKRIIAGVRYTMEKRNFSVSNTYTFAEDVSMETVIKIKEKSSSLDGIDIVEAAVRSYGDGDVIPHLIGTVGAIDADEYSELKESGYSLDDTVGKSGIELAMESTLRGEDGIKTYEMQNDEVVSDTITKEVTPGNSIKLTVDSDFQRNVQTILENHIIWLQNQTNVNKKGEKADAGAIVVLDAKTGALLAAATAPTYNLNDYINNYSEVASRENSPLTNRAIKGLYRPGSTFKTVTATAALNEGIISGNTYITCNGTYNYWEDYKPKCTGYHGSINVITALKESCNIFFYETGRLTGIDLIKSYAKMFGLAGEMGLEIGRETEYGYIASPETYDTLGLDWQAGNIVQAAIGQSETAVTPLQMASLASTIANNGVRYQTYMVDSVYDYNMETLASKTEPTVACTIEDKTGYTFDLVKSGMCEAADFDEYSYPKESDYYTGDYLLKGMNAAIKTGTPQTTSKESTDSAFIGFYPADDPQIAFAGIVEDGEYSKLMIKQIINAYTDSNYKIDKLADGFETFSEEEEEAEEEIITEILSDTEISEEYSESEYSEENEETETDESEGTVIESESESIPEETYYEEIETETETKTEEVIDEITSIPETENTDTNIEQTQTEEIVTEIATESESEPIIPETEQQSETEIITEEISPTETQEKTEEELSDT